jgi:ABC-type lipoprotein release transport system permease subunit
MRSLLWLSLRNLARQKWLALILAVSVSVPLMSYLVLSAARAELYRRYDHLSQTFLVVQQAGSMGEFYGSRLPVDDTVALLTSRGVSLIEPEIRTATGTDVKDMVLLRGISLPNYQQVEPFQMVAGQPLSPGDPPRRVMLGERLAQDRSADIGSAFLIRGREFQVQGIFSTGVYSDYEAWIALDDAQTLLGWGDDVSIFVIPAGESLQAGDMLPGELDVVQKGESGANLVAELQPLFELLTLIAVTLGICAAVNLANALWRLAWQHRLDLSILQTVGFTRLSLMTYLGAQGAAVTLAGFLLATSESALVMAFARLQKAGIVFQPTLDASTFLTSLGFAVGVFVFSIVLPVVWLAHLNLSNLLRSE